MLWLTGVSCWQWAVPTEGALAQALRGAAPRPSRATTPALRVCREDAAVADLELPRQQRVLVGARRRGRAGGHTGVQGVSRYVRRLWGNVAGGRRSAGPGSQQLDGACDQPCGGVVRQRMRAVGVCGGSSGRATYWWRTVIQDGDAAAAAGTVAPVGVISPSVKQWVLRHAAGGMTPVRG